MILLLVIAAAIAVALLRGGNLRQLGKARIRWAWLALIALAIQLTLIRFTPAWIWPARLLFPLTHVAMLAMAWANRDLAGMRLFAAGVALNLFVMLANGGFMPIAPEAMVQAGFAERAEAVALHTRRPASKGLVLARNETALWWLSDIIALRFPIQTVFSVGDILIAAGLFLFIQRIMLQREG